MIEKVFTNGHVYTGESAQPWVSAFAIENGQFLYNGKVFTNLSTIAEAITGSNWSGPRFFGMRARTSRSKERNV